MVITELVNAGLDKALGGPGVFSGLGTAGAVNPSLCPPPQPRGPRKAESDPSSSLRLFQQVGWGWSWQRQHL